MKILPRKSDIDKAQQAERKAIIDEGKILVTQIEDLRRLKDEEERNLMEWRKGSMKQIQYEVDQFIEERDNLEKQNNEARIVRDQLLAPLNEEWELLDKAKAQIIEDKQTLYLEFEQLKIEKKKDEESKKKIKQSVDKIRKIESEAQKALIEAKAIKEYAENEKEMIAHEHIIQNEEYQRRLDEVQLIKATYQNGLNVTEMENQRLKDWEDDLIIREKDLQRRITNLQRVEGVHYVNSQPTDN